MIRFRLLTAASGTFVACLFSSAPAQTVVSNDEWGGARLFVVGEEVVPPLVFTGLGLSTLFVNGAIIDPLFCPGADNATGFRLYDKGPWWCGNGPRPWNAPSRIEQQEALIADLVALSSHPVIALGCEYRYAPDQDWGARVLSALDACAYETAIHFGAPRDFIHDLKARLAN